jgi:zinc-ribbon family
MLAFIVFGWGGGRRKDHGAAVPAHCPNCRNAVMFRYFSVTKWFSLFFIPLIPYQTSHLLLCPVCTRGMRLERGQVEQAKQLVASSAAFSSGSMSHDDYEREVQAFWAGALGHALPPDQLTTEPAPPAIPPPPPAIPPPPSTTEPPRQP